MGPVYLDPQSEMGMWIAVYLVIGMLWDVWVFSVLSRFCLRNDWNMFSFQHWSHSLSNPACFFMNSQSLCKSYHQSESAWLVTRNFLTIISKKRLLERMKSNSPNKTMWDGHFPHLNRMLTWAIPHFQTQHLRHGCLSSLKRWRNARLRGKKWGIWATVTGIFRVEPPVIPLKICANMNKNCRNRWFFTPGN